MSEARARLTVLLDSDDPTLSDNSMIGLDAAAISLLAAIGAEFVADVYFYGDQDE